MSEKLKPCPFCGDATARVDESEGFVLCIRCDTYGPTGRGRAEAIRLWNTRKDASHE